MDGDRVHDHLRTVKCFVRHVLQFAGPSPDGPRPASRPQPLRRLLEPCEHAPWVVNRGGRDVVENAGLRLASPPPTDDASLPASARHRRLRHAVLPPWQVVRGVLGGWHLGQQGLSMAVGPPVPSCSLAALKSGVAGARRTWLPVPALREATFGLTKSWTREESRLSLVFAVDAHA
jgi:hypothetical protein